MLWFDTYHIYKTLKYSQPFLKVFRFVTSEWLSSICTSAQNLSERDNLLHRTFHCLSSVVSSCYQLHISLIVWCVQGHCHIWLLAMTENQTQKTEKKLSQMNNMNLVVSCIEKLRLRLYKKPCLQLLSRSILRSLKKTERIQGFT